MKNLITTDSHEFRMVPSQLLLEPQRMTDRKARSPLHVLIIEDDPVTQHLVTQLLGGTYCVRSCDNPFDAVNEYLAFLPDLVFIDINLGSGEYHGMDVLHTIMRHDPNAYAVIMTAHECDDNKDVARMLGAKGFIGKPFTRLGVMRQMQECELAKGK